MPRPHVAYWLGVAVGLAGCAAEAREATGPCPGLEGCGAPCPSRDCPPGLSCDRFLGCWAECTPSTAARDCAAGDVCTPAGRCGRLDGGVDAAVCAAADVTLTPLVPTVVFLVDRSGSMRAPFRDTDTTRWDAVGDALFGRSARHRGVVVTEAGRALFGLGLYSGEAARCPDLVWARARLDAVDALAGTFAEARPGGTGTTPTAEAVRAAHARLLAESVPGTRLLLVLATDGEPDRCDDPGVQGPAARRAVVEAVRDAHDAGVETHVVSLADLDAVHLQDVANAGVGLPALGAYGEGDPRAPVHAPDAIDTLRETLREIVGGARGCDVALDGRLLDVAAACREGDVRLDGRPLPCGDPDGYRLVDETHLLLLGNACTAFLIGAATHLEARFPCVEPLR